jgi:hypothetical protein
MCGQLCCISCKPSANANVSYPENQTSKPLPGVASLKKAKFCLRGLVGAWITPEPPVSFEQPLHARLQSGTGTREPWVRAMERGRHDAIPREMAAWYRGATAVRHLIRFIPDLRWCGKLNVSRGPKNRPQITLFNLRYERNSFNRSSVPSGCSLDITWFGRFPLGLFRIPEELARIFPYVLLRLSIFRGFPCAHFLTCPSETRSWQPLRSYS